MRVTADLTEPDRVSFFFFFSREGDRIGGAVVFLFLFFDFPPGRDVGRADSDGVLTTRERGSVRMVEYIVRGADGCGWTSCLDCLAPCIFFSPSFF